MASEMEEVVIERALVLVPATIIVSCFSADLEGDDWSVTLMVKVEVPAVVGVPEITPVAALKLKPTGKEPS